MEMSSPRTASTLEGGAPFEPGSNVVQTPLVRDAPQLPPASMAEAEAFLNDVMPTEFVPSALVCVLDSLASFYSVCQNR
jgi:hypothetical protein